MRGKRVLTPVVCGVFLFAAGAGGMRAQTTPAAACGVENTSFKTKADGGKGLTAPPAGQALIYVIEQMPSLGFLTTHVKFGMDGRWLAQLQKQSYTSFGVDPGVHHLCMRYEGQALPTALDAAVLRRLEVQAGKTYYLLYRGFATRDAGEIGFFDEVDEDEGRYALQSSEHVVSVAERK